MGRSISLLREGDWSCPAPLLPRLIVAQRLPHST